MTVAESVCEREFILLSGCCETFALTRARAKPKYVRLAEASLLRHLLALFMLCGM